MNFEVIPTPDFEKSFKALAKRHKSLKLNIQYIRSLPSLSHYCNAKRSERALAHFAAECRREAKHLNEPFAP